MVKVMVEVTPIQTGIANIVHNVAGRGVEVGTTVPPAADDRAGVLAVLAVLAKVRAGVRVVVQVAALVVAQVRTRRVLARSMSEDIT